MPKSTQGAALMSRRSLNAYRVAFCVLDYYTIALKARDANSAIEKAQGLYERHGEEPFTFDISQGGTHNWDAEEVRP